MLIGFTVENFRSFLGETSLSMKATTDKEHRAFNVMSAQSGDLLKNVLIYGANASGKSNLIHALYYMKKMVSSPFDAQTELIKTCQPFTFLKEAANTPSRFEIFFEEDGVVYDYAFDILGGKISREYLYKKSQRKTLVFERTAPGYESIKLTADMTDVEPLKKNVREDVLFLTWAAYANNKLAIKIVDWFANKLMIFGLNGYDRVKSDSVSDFAQNFVRKADSDILEMKSQKDGYYSSHTLYSGDWNNTGSVDVPFAKYSSDGTKRMFELSDAFYKALAGSAVIVIDELDLHLHPALVRHLISLINSVEHNPNNAQLICTTHDVMLLDEDIRRDQIWFVDKDYHGVSCLYALSDFKDVRKNSDILKRYLLGVYGAIPDFERGGTNE
ncbi:MAG: ATP-binding protein [Oscillospiraceae bacterium]|jgi:AAA15 family ATPase/GTPase|nr:ATP-binding protein [Oscillospiraceae bacterium]